MIKCIGADNKETVVYNHYENSPEKILVLNWERWLWFSTNWYKPDEKDNIPIDELIVEIKKHDIIFFTYDTSCGVEHMSLLNTINIYEKSLDPEFCESLLEKIDSFNDYTNRKEK